MKLNSEQCITIASKLFEDWLETHHTGCKIGIMNGEICVFPVTHFKENFSYVNAYTYDRLLKGLSSREWNRLGEKLCDALSED